MHHSLFIQSFYIKQEKLYSIQRYRTAFYLKSNQKLLNIYYSFLSFFC